MGPTTGHWSIAAKFSAGPKDPAYHPLFCHMVDVAAVAAEMWRQVLPWSLRRRLTAAFDLSEEHAGRWVSFVAGIHDLGKASPAFARKDPGFPARARAGGLTIPDLSRLRRPPGHGLISQVTLAHILLDSPFNLPRRQADLVASVAGGHHGTFPTDQEVGDAKKQRTAVGEREWDEVRRALAVALHDVLELAPPGARLGLTSIDAVILAGITSIADWIGSDERFFPYTIPSGERDYLALAAERASTALRRLGWLTSSAPTGARTFHELFPSLPGELWPLQKHIAGLTSCDELPRLLIIEAPMGEGKTEAAMFAADAANVQLGTHGTYFALPTMATSNQMFGRVAEFLRTRFPDAVVQLQLRHGHASFVSEFERIRQDGDSVPQPQYSADVEGGTLVASDWFGPAKRGLLAPFGVGTVDQLLMSVLRVRHGAVRLFGIAAKPIVIDEVHAYDTYMSKLLARTLEWLGALGSPVILLSATLPAGRRESLVNAYRFGAGYEQPAALPPSRYPRVTFVDSSGDIRTTTFDPAPRSVRRLTIERCPRDDPDQLGEILEASLSEGGCAAVVCNTVARAQELYQHLRARFPGEASDGEPIVDLLHARFTLADRQARERRSLARFGKGGRTVLLPDGTSAPVSRPERAILVATQVIEQSLDIDFDLMVSDLAPIDLLLQRSGRLHRHEPLKPRAASLKHPRLVLLEPPVEHGVPQFPESDEYIYAPYVLLRTWLAIRDKWAIDMPDEIEPLIELVYGEESEDPELEETLREALFAFRKQAEEDLQRDTNEALQRMVKRPLPGESLADLLRAELEEDAPEIHRAYQALTRQGPPTANVVLLHESEAGPALDRSGRPAPLGEVTDPTAIRALVERSVTLNHQGVVHRILATERPWPRTPLLRHARMLVLDTAGEARVDGYVLRYDSELGLLVSRTNG